MRLPLPLTLSAAVHPHHAPGADGPLPRSCGGGFFSKRSRGMMQADRPHMLAVEDPNEPTNDLGKGSYNIQKVVAHAACLPARTVRSVHLN